MQTTGLPPTQTPSWQVSVWVQASPSSQGVSLATGSHSPVAGLQVWQSGQPVAQVQGPQSRVVPQPSGRLPQVLPWAAQVVGVQVGFFFLCLRLRRLRPLPCLWAFLRRLRRPAASVSSG